MTHFFANMRGKKADELKTLLWKIQDEFVSMHYEGRENLEMRWFEGDILAVQEHLTAVADLDGDGNAAGNASNRLGGVPKKSITRVK
jgi:hypothetical protein